MKVRSLAQLPSVAEVRNDAPIERIEARELALRAPSTSLESPSGALGLEAPAPPSEHAMDALAAATQRDYGDARLATMFRRASSMLELRDTVRHLRRGVHRA